jgi:hypothetical protein
MFKRLPVAITFGVFIINMLFSFGQAADVMFMDLCLVDSNCNTKFFKLKNMCCGIKCCNYIEFVFLQSNDKIMSNFLHTFKHPRAINIFIGVFFVFFVLFLVGVVLAMIKKFSLKKVRSVHKTHTVLKEISRA